MNSRCKSWCFSRSSINICWGIPRPLLSFFWIKKIPGSYPLFLRGLVHVQWGCWICTGAIWVGPKLEPASSIPSLLEMLTSSWLCAQAIYAKSWIYLLALCTCFINISNGLAEELGSAHGIISSRTNSWVELKGEIVLVSLSTKKFPLSR
jgi:hypothetical protein